MQMELIERLDQLADALSQTQDASLEKLPPDGAANQLYREVNEVKSIVEAAPAGWRDLQMSFAEAADDLRSRLDRPLERLSPEASQRQLYNELIELRDLLQRKVDDLDLAQRGRQALLEEQLQSARADIARWREEIAESISAAARPAEGGRAGLNAMRGAFDAVAAHLTDLAGLRGGPDSAIYRDYPAMVERLHGSLEMARQEKDAARAFSAAAASPFANGTWTRIAGGGENRSWTKGYRIRGFCSHEGRLYTTVVSPEAAYDTGIWSWSGGRWRQEFANVRHPDTANGEANALLTFDGKVYAAVSAVAGGLWRSGPDGFEPVGGLSLPGAYCLAEHDGGVVVGCDPAEIYLYRDGKLERIAGGGEKDSWFADEIDGGVYTLASHNGDLYAGLAMRSYGPTPATVWRLRGGRWEAIGGEGVGGSWAHPHIGYVLDLTPFQDRLMACLTRPRTLPMAASSVYALDGERWSPVAPGAVPWRMHRSHIFNHAVEWRGRYYLATGDSRAKLTTSSGARSAVWELSDDGRGWTCVGGGGDHPAWAQTDLETLLLDDQRTGGLWIYRMHVHEDRLVCGFAGHERAAEVWMFTPHDAAPLPTTPEPSTAKTAKVKAGSSKAKAGAAKSKAAATNRPQSRSKPSAHRT